MNFEDKLENIANAVIESEGYSWKHNPKTKRVVAYEKDSPDIPRAWGEGETLAIAELNCEIAIRKKVINKLESGSRFACVGNYFYKQEQ
jgi:hypothetical protein|tara:strand:- start:70 stop:336 length:267 start_codon:yes stop_codon:yes gene_type:complete